MHRQPRPVTAAAAAAVLLAAGGLAVAAGPASASADGTAVRIHDIQGDTRVSPYAGKAVTGVAGIVTAIRSTGSSRGFWMQDPHPDSNAATSEGIFVYTGKTTPATAVGDAVTVSATVSEYYAGGKDAGGQSTTELTGATWTTGSTKNTLPAPVALDTDSVPAAYAPAGAKADGSIEGLTLQPSKYALDRYESLEGMRVSTGTVRVVGPTNTYGEMYVTVRPGDHRTPRGGTLYGAADEQNGGRLMIASLGGAVPKLNTGDELTGTTTGPLDQPGFGAYAIDATRLGTPKDNGLKPETAKKPADGQLTVATFNVENLSPADDAAKFTRLAQAIAGNLRSPDIISLEEVQDDNGPTDDGTVTAGKTLKQLTDAITAAGGPAYTWKEIDPVNDKDGGQPGGNIRQAFLYNPKRVTFTDRAGGTPTSSTTVTGSGAGTALSASPGRIDPGSTAWTDSRKPLAGQFAFRGQKIFVIANHFNSKGGDQGLDSRFQPPALSSEKQRSQQAGIVHDFVAKLRAADPNARAVVLGDLNDYSFSKPVKTLTAGGTLDDLITTLPANQQYTYDYQGNSQVLDHILTTPGTGRTDYQSVHINAEFAGQMSDHDPQLVRITP